MCEGALVFAHLPLNPFEPEALKQPMGINAMKPREARTTIQGLNQKVEELLKAKDAEIQELKKSVAELKALVERLADK